MRVSPGQPLRRSLTSLLALASVAVWSCGPDSVEPTGPAAGPNLALGAQPPSLAKALAAQARHTDKLLQIDGVVGTAVGLSANGGAEVQLYTTTADVLGLPTRLNGVPVSVVVTGEIRPIPVVPEPAGRRPVDRTGSFSRPVPIGVSTGNEGECSVGTIGARVVSDGATYALSNNHVYALQNKALLGSSVLQPGRGDLNCASGSNAVFGPLSRFVTIEFSASANNRVDAAIASATSSTLARSTPRDGYGIPSVTIVAAALDQAVQKYGRTTGLTTGTVVGLNSIINVGYSSGPARFVGQITI